MAISVVLKIQNAESGMGFVLIGLTTGMQFVLKEFQSARIVIQWVFRLRLRIGFPALKGFRLKETRDI